MLKFFDTYFNLSRMIDMRSKSRSSEFWLPATVTDTDYRGHLWMANPVVQINGFLGYDSWASKKFDS